MRKLLKNNFLDKAHLWSVRTLIGITLAGAVVVGFQCYNYITRFDSPQEVIFIDAQAVPQVPSEGYTPPSKKYTKKDGCQKMSRTAIDVRPAKVEVWRKAKEEEVALEQHEKELELLRRQREAESTITS